MTTEISVAETRPFRPSSHSECGPQKIEQSQTSTVVDSDKEPLLHHEVRSRFQSEASPRHIVRTPPTRATQLEDVTNSLDLGFHPMPISVSDVDHEAISDYGDSTFLDHFERDLGVCQR